MSESSKQPSPVPSHGLILDPLCSSTDELRSLHLPIVVLLPRMASHEDVSMDNGGHWTSTGYSGSNQDCQCPRSCEITFRHNKLTSLLPLTTKCDVSILKDRGTNTNDFPLHWLSRYQYVAHGKRTNEGKKGKSSSSLLLLSRWNPAREQHR